MIIFPIPQYLGINTSLTAQLHVLSHSISNEKVIVKIREKKKQQQQQQKSIPKVKNENRESVL